MLILEFKNWLLFEAEDSNIETKTGAELLRDPAMEVAMYLAYRASYDEVAKADHEEAIAHRVSQGDSAEDAASKTKFQPPWSQDDWKYSPSGGTRAPKWTFSGIFPNESDLAQVRKHMEEFNSVQELADANVIQLNRVGGVSYRDRGESIKMTGMWGWNPRAKMLAVAHMTHDANQGGKQIFTAADSRLMDMINRSSPLMQRMHKQGKVPSSDFGLHSPPPDLVPYLYKGITNDPAAQGGGTWSGHNPDGSLNFDLSGIGMRKKFLMANQPFWKSQLGKAFSSAGIGDKEIGQLKMALNTGGFVANMATSMVNKKLKDKDPSASSLSAETLKWILSRMS